MNRAAQSVFDLSDLPISLAAAGITAIRFTSDPLHQLSNCEKIRNTFSEFSNAHGIISIKKDATVVFH